MPGYPIRIQTTDVIRFVRQRRDTKYSPLLFLGARCGSLFHARSLYHNMERSGWLTFADISQEEQFARCYRVLARHDYTEQNLASLIEEALHTTSCPPAHLYLAELVRAGFFDMIISTNIDDCLERAFIRADMKPGKDFHVCIPQRDLIDQIAPLEKTSSCILLKIFGDFTLGRYTLLKSDSYIDAHERLKNFLITHFREDVLMIGYDPLWDHAVQKIFPAEGQEFWYINEEDWEKSLLLHQLQQRQGRGLIGGDGRYSTLMYALHWQLLWDSQPRPQVAAPPLREAPPIAHTLLPGVTDPVPPDALAPPVEPLEPLISRAFHSTPQLHIPNEPERETPAELPAVLKLSPAQKLPAPARIPHPLRNKVSVFNSKYSNKKYISELRDYFKQYEIKGIFATWDEKHITAGSNWRKEIATAVAETRVAIILVDVKFLGSRFLTENVLPSLLQTAREQGADILPVLIGYCDYTASPLEPFRLFNSPDKPLNALKRVADREAEWDRLAQTVFKIMMGEPGYYTVRDQD